jgi:glycine/D-amino acid oxidase-like deaminating enzyme
MRMDFAVVGGGIAGLAIAELLQRSGASVLLLEKNPRLCAEASAEQQGWFHTGALYTALPNQFYFRAMVGNLDDLVDYYSGFSGMNLRVDKHLSTTTRDGWFENRTNFYAYVNCRGVRWKWKLPWAVALYRAKRRMSWYENLDASRSISRQLGIQTKPTRFVVHGAQLGVHLDHVAFVLKSRDRGMDTTRIAPDLLGSFLGHGGTIRTGFRVIGVERGSLTGHEGAEARLTRIQARHIIVAAGKASQEFDATMRVFASPLLVVSPALRDVNFVYMTPHVRHTLNHLYHRHDGVEYSVIGNAVYYDASAGVDRYRDAAWAHMLGMARRIFGEVDERRAALYFGYKTEVTSSSFIRNYLYHILDRDGYTLVLPGKYSLCFSLAVNVCRHFGIEPVEGVRSDKTDATAFIEEPRHLQIAKQLAMSGPVPAAQAAEVR